MMKMQVYSPAICMILLLVQSGCASLSGDLRRDLNDEPATYRPPTIGGAWPERHYLSEIPSEPGSGNDSITVGHMNRQPGSVADYGAGQSSWINPEQRENNLRDEYRSSFGASDRGQTYSQNPEMAPPQQRQFYRADRARAEDFIDNAENDGSLWASNGQTNYYFTKNRIKGVGDIISITVNDALIKDISTEIRNSLDQAEIVQELQKAQTKLNDQASNTDGTKRSPAAGEKKSDAFGNEAKTDEKKEDVKTREANINDIDIKSSLQIAAGEPIMGEVMERFPNGNYKVRAAKRVGFGNSMRVVTLVGVAKGSDVNDKETIEAGSLYEYMVKVFR